MVWICGDDSYQVASHRADNDQDTTGEGLSDFAVTLFAVFDLIVEIDRTTVIRFFSFMR